MAEVVGVVFEADRHLPAHGRLPVERPLAGLERGDFEIHFPRAFSRRLKLLRLLPYRWYFAIVRKATGV